MPSPIVPPFTTYSVSVDLEMLYPHACTLSSPVFQALPL